MKKRSLFEINLNVCFSYRVLFWTDWGAVPKIEKMYTNGTGKAVLVSADIFWPNGIALDLPSQRLYWTEAKKSTIEVITYAIAVA